MIDILINSGKTTDPDDGFLIVEWDDANGVVRINVSEYKLNEEMTEEEQEQQFIDLGKDIFAFAKR